MGGSFIEILGTGFQLPPTPPASGPVPKPNPSVTVQIGSKYAENVMVVSSTRLLCTTTPNDPGVYSVTVQNVDQDGLLVPGETITAASAYTYRLVNLAKQSYLTWVTRKLVEEIKRQVLSEVVLTEHTDWDPLTGDALNITHIADLPAIALVGPATLENRFYSLNQQVDVRTNATTYMRRRRPRTIDMSFDYVGLSNNSQQLLNLSQASVAFFERNKFLTVPALVGDNNSGAIEYELDFVTGRDFVVAGNPSNSNVRSFRGAVYIRGVDLEALEYDFVGDEWVDAGGVTEDTDTPVTLDLENLLGF